MNNQVLKEKTIQFDQFQELSSEEKTYLSFQELQSLKKQQSDFFSEIKNQYQDMFSKIVAILQPKDDSPTFGDMARSYLDSKAKPDKNFKRILKDVLIPKLGRQTLQQINKKMIVKVLAEELKEIRKRMQKKGKNMNEISGHSEINKYLSSISVVFNHAIGLGMFEGHSPTQGIKKKEVDPRRTYIDDVTFEKLIHGCPEQHQKNMLKLAYLTAQRPSDVLKMQWRDIVDGFLRVHQGKTKKKLKIKIEGQLKVLIDSLSKEKNPYLIGKKVKYTTIANELKKITKKLDIDFQLRDLRAKGATDKAKRCGLIEAQRQLGHDSARLTANVYVRNEWGDTVTPTC